MENINKVYIVHWGSAGQDDDGNAVAFAGVHGVYTDFGMAKQGLLECKEETYNEIVNDPDFDEETVECLKADTYVYGSVQEGYFEIDYTLGDAPCEIHIILEEKEITDIDC
jgi:hypothetical protein